MKLLEVSEVADLVQRNRPLLLAGDEAALGQVPKGNWIGGTIPYFMTSSGGCQDARRIFAHELPNSVDEFQVRTYSTSEISQVYEHGFDNGLTVLIIPAMSAIHQSFANDALEYPNFAMVPLVGWISGVALADLGRVHPKIFDGTKLHQSTDHAVAMHLKLKQGYYANVDIINLFKPGGGDVLVFPKSGFAADDVLVNGQRLRLSDYIEEKQVDLKLPLVADYCGAHINVSFQSVDKENKRVLFYAPVFENVPYYLAQPVENYTKAFESQVAACETSNAVFSCNCILNYLYGELEGKRTGSFSGPITFGEIAFQLLNQTLVYVDVKSL